MKNNEFTQVKYSFIKKSALFSHSPKQAITAYMVISRKLGHWQGQNADKKNWKGTFHRFDIPKIVQLLLPI